QCAHAVFPAAGRLHHHDLFHLRLRPHGHGLRHPSRRGRTIAIDQLWRNFPGVDLSWFWRADEHEHPQETGTNMTYSAERGMMNDGRKPLGFIHHCFASSVPLSSLITHRLMAALL